MYSRFTAKETIAWNFRPNFFVHTWTLTSIRSRLVITDSPRRTRTSGTFVNIDTPNRWPRISWTTQTLGLAIYEEALWIWSTRYSLTRIYAHKKQLSGKSAKWVTYVDNHFRCWVPDRGTDFVGRKSHFPDIQHYSYRWLHPHIVFADQGLVLFPLDIDKHVRPVDSRKRLQAHTRLFEHIRLHLPRNFDKGTLKTK